MDLEELKIMIETDLVIDDEDLDESSTVTPKLYGKYLNIASEHTLKLKKLMQKRDNIYLERWKYYLGKQPDAYYKKHGFVKDIITKTEVHMFLKADPLLNQIDDIMNQQEIMVDLIENTLKEIKQRSYHIRNAIEWRKFTNGG